MPIHLTNGNMFDINADILINTVNCVGVMGKGVALQFKQKYPVMFEEYKEDCRRGCLYPGSVTDHTINDGKRILNFATKNHWRDNSKYAYIETGLNNLFCILKDVQNKTIVAMPALGCGNGGLDWDNVLALIKRYLSDLNNVEIFVFEPNDKN